MTLLTEIERAALLKCRHAGRYDTGKKTRVPATKRETADEHEAWEQEIPALTWKDLDRRGFIARERGSVYRLTAAGRNALEEALKGAA